MTMHIAIDIETSDISLGAGGRVIEVAALVLSELQIVEEYSTLIDAPCTISLGAQKVHCISAMMLQNQPPPEQVWPHFKTLIVNYPIIAHNAKFDIPFIRHELTLLGLSLTNPSICTLQQSRRLLPHLPSYSLDSVVRHLLGKVPENCTRHRALGDARLAAMVWVEMERRRGRT